MVENLSNFRVNEDAAQIEKRIVLKFFDEHTELC